MAKIFVVALLLLLVSVDGRPASKEAGKHIENKLKEFKMRLKEALAKNSILEIKDILKGCTMLKDIVCGGLYSVSKAEDEEWLFNLAKDAVNAKDKEEMVDVFKKESTRLAAIVLCEKPKKEKKMQDEPAIDKPNYDDKFFSFLVQRKRRSIESDADEPLEVQKDEIEKNDDGLSEEIQDETEKQERGESKEIAQDWIEMTSDFPPEQLQDASRHLEDNPAMKHDVTKKVDGERIPPIRDSHVANQRGTQDESLVPNDNQKINNRKLQGEYQTEKDTKGNEEDSREYEFKQATVVQPGVALVEEHKNSVSLKTTVLGGDGQFDEAIVIDPNHPNNVKRDFHTKTTEINDAKKELKKNIDNHLKKKEFPNVNLLTAYEEPIVKKSIGSSIMNKNLHDGKKETTALDELENDIEEGEPKASEIKYEED